MSLDPQRTRSFTLAATLSTPVGRPVDLSIEWLPGLLVAIRDYVATTYYSKNAHGVDLGGILLGVRDGDTLKVLSWQPIERGPNATSHFHLTNEDENALARQLAPLEKEHQVLGWFRSRNSGAFQAEEHDRALHLKFFSSAPLFLVIRPSHQRPSDVQIFQLTSDSSLHLAQRLHLLPPQIPGVSLAAAPQKPRPRFSWKHLTLVCFTMWLVLAACLFSLQWLEQSKYTPTPDSLNFEVRLNGSHIEASWNPYSAPVRASDFAQLSFTGEKLRLSRSELLRGSLQLPLKNDTNQEIEISLQVGNREELARLIPAIH